MKMRKNWKVEDYEGEKRLVIKRMGKWTMTFDLDGTGYYPYDLRVDDGWVCYYMDDRKAWDNFFPIPQTVIDWCENIGVKYLEKFLEEKYL